MSKKHQIPNRLNSYLIRLFTEYKTKQELTNLDIIGNCRWRVQEETSYDDFGGGTYGHDVRLYLPLQTLGKIEIRAQAKIAESICDDLNALCQSIPNEFFRAVQLELNDENDPEYQSATNFSDRPPTAPKTLKFWQPDMVRLFISHRDGHKEDVHKLKVELEHYGISSFVAHDGIEPMAEWRTEILKRARNHGGPSHLSD
jgi:hypothetical protein